MLLIGNSFINNNLIMSFAVVFIIVLTLCLCAIYLGGELIVSEGPDRRFIVNLLMNSVIKLHPIMSVFVRLLWVERFGEY